MGGQDPNSCLGCGVFLAVVTALILGGGIAEFLGLV
ncbi:hypothetical protein FHU37_002169 [Allostreptomyces psammosilenae]|uniref:Uncharacterized protein n=1 Tax=Allostreptomyces psammosilenae TaxID=1892865 RepID=A0A852ZS17_9ACTN|nr:hypothetical protein [Allostreptomyces psammosilenae]